MLSFLDLIGKVRRTPFGSEIPYIQADVVFVVSEFMGVHFSAWNRGARIQITTFDPKTILFRPP